MAFMIQILLNDVPALEARNKSLLSFHYCTQCMYDGRMAWGFQDAENRGYDVRVIDSVESKEPDNLITLGEATLPPSAVTFSDFLEVPSADDMSEKVRASLQDDYFQSGDFEENNYRGLIHRPLCKVGGWPSWVQSAEWPTVGAKKMDFICQIDAAVGERSAWGGGGFAYLFISPSEVSPKIGELFIQTT